MLLRFVLTNYRLAFLPVALKEWRKLAPPIREQFKHKLAERLRAPRIPGDQLRGYPSMYKIKLRAAGYRLVYEVEDATLIVYVIAIGKRNNNAIYQALSSRR